MKAPKIALFGAFTFMMLPAYITRDAEFMDLREKIGPVAMHAIVSLGTTIQLRRENSIKLANASALVRVCDLVGDIDTELLWDALIGSWLIPLGNDCYSMPAWEEWNKQLRSAWANGEKKKEANQKEPKGTESKRTEEKGIEQKRIELDAMGYATSDARSDASSVIKNKPIAW